MIRQALEKVQEQLSAIAGEQKGYDVLISNRCIPLELKMMKRLGYAYSGEKAFHLTNERHLSGLHKIQNSLAQLSTFTQGGPELVRLPSQPNCLIVLEGTEVVRGKSDIWTTVDTDGMRWINHNADGRATKFTLTFMIDGIITKLLKEFGVDFSCDKQPQSEILKAIKQVKDSKKFHKAYFKNIEDWIDSGGYKEFQNYLDNCANFKYNELVLTKFKIKGIYSLDSENQKIEKFCKSKGVEYKGVFGSRALSELKI